MSNKLSTDRVLTLKQERFCKEYTRGKFQGNGTQSYKTAYPCKMTDNECAVEARRLLKLPHLSLRVKELENDRYFQLGVDEDSRLDMIQRCMDGAEKQKQWGNMRGSINELNKMVGGHKEPVGEQANRNSVQIVQLTVPENGRTNVKTVEVEEEE